MSTFEEREKGFEAKFKLDQESKFKINARRNRLLGDWAAAKLGLSGGAAEAYAKQVVQADFQSAGDADVVEKVLKDLLTEKIAIDEAAVRKELDRLSAVARTQVMGESKPK